MLSSASPQDARAWPVAPLAAVVLAGGRGVRLGGGDKALRHLGGRTMLDHVLARIAPQADFLALNANGDPARFAVWGLPVLADPVPDHPGPLAGVLAGLLWARAQGAYDVLIVPADTPFLPSDLVARLRAGRGDAGIACAMSAGRLHPVVGLWRAALADDLAERLAAGDRKVELFLRHVGLAEVVFGPGADGGDPFANVNTPEDLASAERRLAGR
jgi:molybdopterin-guanine dinucleotide biosynthesis protein A